MSGYEVNKNYVPGIHFAEVALEDLKPKLSQMAEGFLAEILKGVGI